MPETSLHRDLKTHYAQREGEQEVRVDGYRIDVVSRRHLVEVQSGSLAAIRDKVQKLLDRHRVVVVKPIVVRKLLVKRAAREGEVVEQRLSPKRGSLLDLFHDLVHFTRVFPHPRLTLDVVLVEIEEWRYTGHGRRRRWRHDDYQIEDQKLVAMHQVHRLRTATDLARLIPCPLPTPFHTGDLARALGVHVRFAQRIAYCLRTTGAVREVGKRGNARLYEFGEASRAAG